MSEDGQQVVATGVQPVQYVVAPQKKKGRSFGSRFYHWMTDKDPKATQAAKRMNA
jgi:hypothetical protein